MLVHRESLVGTEVLVKTEVCEVSPARGCATSRGNVDGAACGCQQIDSLYADFVLRLGLHFRNLSGR